MELDPELAHFTRPGFAYLGGPGALRVYAPHEMRRKWELSCSQGRIDIRTNELQHPSLPGLWLNAVPWCVTDAGLWATGVGTLGVWRSTAGATWQRQSDLPLSGDGRSSWFASLFALRSGRLIAFGRGGAAWHAFWSDDGVNWHAPVMYGTLGGAPYYIHNFCEAPHGTIVAVTYTGVGENTPKQIWRSADQAARQGQAWELVWEGGAAWELPHFRHFHSVVYHPGTDRWIVDTGDNDLAHRHTFTSTDDGRNWHEWFHELSGTNQSSPTGQVTCFRAGHDPDRLYLGSDACQRVGWFDLNKWRVGTFMERQFVSRGFQYVIWDLSQFDGVWYATLASAATGHQAPTVLVSADLSRWAVYGRLGSLNATYQTFGYCAGMLDGYLHYIAVTDGWGLRHAQVPAAQVAAVQGVCVSPAKTNLLTAAQARCDQLYVGWVPAYGPQLFEVDAHHPFAGPGALHIRKTGMSSHQRIGLNLHPAFTCNPGTPYRLHLWVRGQAKEFYVRLGTAATGFGLRVNPTDGSPAWTEVWTPASTAPSPVLHVKIEVSPNEVDRTAELWLGAAELAEAPVDGEWVPPGAPSAPEHFDYGELTFGAEWTHLFSTVLLSGTDDLGAVGQSHIRAYHAPSGTHSGCAEVYYDCPTQSFVLAVNGDPALSSAPRVLLGGTRVYFAVRRSSEGWVLSISDGNGIEQLTGDVPAPTVAGGGSIRSGSCAGDSVAAQVILEDVFYASCALSDAEIEQRFSQPSLKQ